MTLREILATRQAGGGITAPAVAPVAVVMPPPAAAPDRALGTGVEGRELIPMEFPYDATAAAGNQLAVMINKDGGGWLGLIMSDGRFLYLLGPMGSIHAPF